ncbi:MAG: sulfatase-like hydrolase/transferase, partial [Neisseriaceae bacterium]|nr:sulfatase-like hydrolase/transferase [Neisseriaceae bacterium]
MTANENIFKKDFKLPKCDKKALGRFMLSFLLPNMVFLMVCFFLSAVRPLINIDYIFPCLLLAFNNKFIRITGIVLYIAVILADAYTLITQFFQFLDFAALRDFLPFVFDAPKEYIFLYSLLLILLLILPLSAWILNKKIQKTYAVIFSVVMLIVFYLFGYMGNFKYSHRSNDAFATESYFIHSQMYSISDAMSGGFGRALLEPSTLSEFYPNGEYQRASVNIKQPYNHKILLIVAESLGSLKNELVQQEVFRKISEQKDLYEFLNIGEVHINGATVQGEIRELCNKLLHNGHNTRHFTANDFSDCLPQILSQQGYHTVAFHGAGSTMYHRKSLYPKLGFQKLMFNEQMQDKKRCHSFKGTCDSEIFSLVANELAHNEKALVYWLTLTSHYPYSEQDIFNHRFDCKQFNIANNHTVCRNI